MVTICIRKLLQSQPLCLNQSDPKKTAIISSVISFLLCIVLKMCNTMYNKRMTINTQNNLILSQLHIKCHCREFFSLQNKCFLRLSIQNLLILFINLFFCQLKYDQLYRKLIRVYRECIIFIQKIYKINCLNRRNINLLINQGIFKEYTNGVSVDIPDQVVYLSNWLFLIFLKENNSTST